jgi:hypothetical protein
MIVYFITFVNEERELPLQYYLKKCKATLWLIIRPLAKFSISSQNPYQN